MINSTSQVQSFLISPSSVIYFECLYAAFDVFTSNFERDHSDTTLPVKNIFSLDCIRNTRDFQVFCTSILVLSIVLLIQSQNSTTQFSIKRFTISNFFIHLRKIWLEIRYVSLNSSKNESNLFWWSKTILTIFSLYNFVKDYSVRVKFDAKMNINITFKNHYSILRVSCQNKNLFTSTFARKKVF